MKKRIIGGAACALVFAVGFGGGFTAGQRTAQVSARAQAPVIARRPPSARPGAHSTRRTPVASATSPAILPEAPVSATPTVGPQVTVRSSAYCTTDQLCITLRAYGVDMHDGSDVGEKALNLYFHVANHGTADNGVGWNEFEAGIKGGEVIDAEVIGDGPTAGGTLVAGGTHDGLITFLVPLRSHQANVRLTDGLGDTETTWTITY